MIVNLVFYYYLLISFEISIDKKTKKSYAYNRIAVTGQ